MDAKEPKGKVVEPRLETSVYAGLKDEKPSIQLDEVGTEGINVESPPEGWITRGRLRTETGAAYSYIDRLAEQYREEHPDWFRTYQYKSKSVLYLSPVLADKVREALLSRESVPAGWITKSTLSEKIALSPQTIEKIAEEYREEHPDWFGMYANEQGRIFEYYHPELVSIVTQEANEIGPAPIGWVNRRQLARNLNRAVETLDSIAEQYREEHPDWFCLYKNAQGGVFEYYHPDLVTKLTVELEVSNQVPEGWLTVGDLATALGVNRNTANKMIGQYREEHPDWFGTYPNPRNNLRAAMFVSPDLFGVIKAEVLKIETVPEGWVTRNKLAVGLNVSDALVSRLAEQYREEHPDWFQLYRSDQGRVLEHYHPDLIQVIREGAHRYETAPDGWETAGSLAAKLGIKQPKARELAEQHSESYPEEFREYKTKGGGIRRHYGPRIVEIVRSYVELNKGSKEETRLDREERRRLVDSLDAFVRGVEGGETLDGQQFIKLAKLFGGENAMDIVYQLHDEFRGIDIGYARSTLGEYLGETLTIKGEFSLDFLDKTAVESLNNPNLRSAFTEVVKRDCLSYFNDQRRQGSPHSDLDIVLGRLAVRKGETREINSEVINQVIDEVAEYYRSACEDFNKPPQIIDGLREGREFPDINQRINMKEISDKKKMLIADGMGLGKSASAILSKEILGVKQALVVVPSNVIDVWRDYLSDKVSEDGKQIGYFKPGQAPRVLVVKDPNSLNEIDTSEYDYVLVSQERLDKQHIDGLESLDYGMLIVDEVHKLKNIKSGVRAEHLLRLAEKIEEGDDDKYLALLSGTPVPNKPSDVAMILQLLYPEKFSDVNAKELTSQIVKGDVLDLRSLLLPRMQMKELIESVEMPDLHIETLMLEISDIEKEIYEVLLEEDELTALQKIHVLRQALLNSHYLRSTPDFEGSKVAQAGGKLRSTFETKDKVVMFVNGYVDGVLSGDNTIIDGLGLPDDIEVKTIYGDVKRAERLRIQEDLAEEGRRILLLVSGQTADVGVDFSSAQAVVHYNEPWSKYEKEQQDGRVYRPGLQDDLTSTTLISRGTIEEGIHRYIAKKYQAIEKIMRGIPVSEIEREMLRKSEARIEKGHDVNASIAEHYLSTTQKLNNIFGYVKELGEPGFKKFLSEGTNAADYAQGYSELGSRSYQANATRLSGTVIDAIVREKGQQPEELRILDLASGPEMLKRHIPGTYTESVLSLDMNELHFSSPGSGRVKGSMMSEMPIGDKTVDYVNLSLGLHYTKYVPSQGVFERVEALQQINRVLKPGGTAVINLMYSLDLRDEEAFRSTLTKFGFRIVDDYSGDVRSGSNFATKLFTLEKVEDCPVDVDEMVRALGPSSKNSLKFTRSGRSLRDARRISASFAINDDRELSTAFSTTDQRALMEEQSLIIEMEQLRSEYGGIERIPVDVILSHEGVARIYNGARYILYKRLTTAPGIVVVR